MVVHAGGSVRVVSEFGACGMGWDVVNAGGSVRVVCGFGACGLGWE